jgi:hypothetical protein
MTALEGQLLQRYGFLGLIKAGVSGVESRSANLNGRKTWSHWREISGGSLNLAWPRLLV